MASKLSKQQIEDYLKKQGYPEPSPLQIYQFENAGEHQAHFDEAVENNYEIADFDRWIVLMDLLGTEMTFKTAMAFDSDQGNEDIETLELQKDIQYDRMKTALCNILTAIDDTLSGGDSELKANILRSSGLTQEELKHLGLDYLSEHVKETDNE